MVTEMVSKVKIEEVIQETRVTEPLTLTDKAAANLTEMDKDKLSNSKANLNNHAEAVSSVVLETNKEIMADKAEALPLNNLVAVVSALREAAVTPVAAEALVVVEEAAAVDKESLSCGLVTSVLQKVL